MESTSPSAELGGGVSRLDSKIALWIDSERNLSIFSSSSAAVKKVDQGSNVS